MTRRTHSSIDRLPADLSGALVRMFVDNIFPGDYLKDPDYDGKPRYEDGVAYCVQKGFSVSPSAIGRFGMQMRTQAMMKNAGLIARETMAGLTDEDSSKTIKAAAEMMTALNLQFMVENRNFTSRQLKEVSQAIRDCAQVAIKAQQHLSDQIKTKVTAAAASTKKKLGKAGVDRKLIQEIIDEHLGVVKS